MQTDSHLLLFVTYHSKPSLREAFINEVTSSGILDKIRSEEGCLRYRYFLDAADPDSILLVEEWESVEMQAAHMKMPHMEELAQIKDRYVDHTTVEKFQ